MGAVAYGRRVRQDEESVAYTFGVTPHDPEGVVVIPLAEPGSWYSEGGAGQPVQAEWVVLKVLRLHRTTGRWPDEALFSS